MTADTNQLENRHQSTFGLDDHPKTNSDFCHNRYDVLPLSIVSNYGGAHFFALNRDERFMPIYRFAHKANKEIHHLVPQGMGMGTLI